MLSHEYVSTKLHSWVYFLNMTSFWPPVTSVDLLSILGSNAIAYVSQRYNMGMHAKNWVPECIFQIWPPFDLLWPPVTSDDIWGQNVIAYFDQGYHMSMCAKNWVPEGIFRFCPNWPYFDLFLISNDLYKASRSKKYSLWRFWVSYEYSW